MSTGKHKPKKRLRPGKSKRLNPKEAAYAKALAKTLDPKAAVTIAYPKTVSPKSKDTQVARLWSRAHVREAFLEELEKRIPDLDALIAQNLETVLRAPHKELSGVGFSASDKAKAIEQATKLKDIQAPARSENLTARGKPQDFLKFPKG